MATSNSSLTFKLFIDKNRKRVLYAEADKHFADFLFGLLSLRVGGVINLLSKDRMVGCLAKLYESFENLSEEYTLPHVDNYDLLRPCLSSPCGGIEILNLLTDRQSPADSDESVYEPDSDEAISEAEDDKPSKRGLSICGPCRNCPTTPCYVAYLPDVDCPSCRRTMDKQAVYVAPPLGSSAEEKGYVKDVMYMVMDDLEVKPLSTTALIDVLNKFGVKDVGDLQEKVVHLGWQEGVKLLRGSLLSSKSILTLVFLGRAS